jgi:hypothetical protein
MNLNKPEHAVGSQDMPSNNEVCLKYEFKLQTIYRTNEIEKHGISPPILLPEVYVMTINTL